MTPPSPTSRPGDAARDGEFLDEFPRDEAKPPASAGTGDAALENTRLEETDFDEDDFEEIEDDEEEAAGGRVIELPRYDPLPDERLQEVMDTGEVELIGRMPHSSNGTFLCHVRLGDDATLAIYKPARGERPLWDFPPGLWQREVAAYEVSVALDWHLVPMTVTRDVEPLGIGSLQRFVYARFDEHYFTLVAETEHHPALRRFCAFDLVANNTDRKGGHILIDDDKRLWGIDHGLCFSTGSHLRTVIWDFDGDELTGDDQAALLGLADTPPGSLDDLLTVSEIEQLCTRARRLAEIGALPHVPERHRGYPWPML